MPRWGESAAVPEAKLNPEPRDSRSIMDETTTTPPADCSETQDGFVPAEDSALSRSLGDPWSSMTMGVGPSTATHSFCVSTPVDRFSDWASIGFQTHGPGDENQQLKDQPPTCPLALKDRSNQKMTPRNKQAEQDKAQKESESKAGSKRASTTHLARFALEDEPPECAPGTDRKKSQALSASGKRRKKSDANLFVVQPGSRKGRPVLAVAAATGMQHLVRSSAQFIGSTFQNAFASNIKAQATNKEQHPRDIMTPQKRKLPTFDQVDSIRKLVRSYTLLDPIDRQDSVESLLIQNMTGYTLNPPMASTMGSVSARSPIQTRSGKLENLLKLNIDLFVMDACKNRDQQQAEICTLCRYEREGYKFRFVHIPSGKTISPEQYEARYLCMLQQVCKTRSEYWSNYFRRLYGTADGAVFVSGVSDQEAVNEAINGVATSNVQVHIDGDDKDHWVDLQANALVSSTEVDPERDHGCDPTGSSSYCVGNNEAIVVFDETKSVNQANVHDQLAPSALLTGGSCLFASSLATGQLYFSAESSDGDKDWAEDLKVDG